MALEIQDVLRERRFLAAFPSWRIFSLSNGAVWRAERDENGEIVVTVRFTLPDLLDRLQEIEGPAEAE